MRTRCIATFTLATVVFAAGGVAGITLAQDKPQDKPAAGAAQDPAAMMAKPGPEHEALKMDEGTWKAQVKFWMAPNTPPEESTGVEANKLTLGGLWLVSDYKDDGGMFAGHGVTGYDTQKKKYVGVWVDTMTTYMGTSEGTFDKSTKTATFTGEAPDMTTGKMQKHRSVMSYPSADTRRLEAYTTGADGKEWKTLEIQYTRAK